MTSIALVPAVPVSVPSTAPAVLAAALAASTTIAPLPAAMSSSLPSWVSAIPVAPSLPRLAAGSGTVRTSRGVPLSVDSTPSADCNTVKATFPFGA